MTDVSEVTVRQHEQMDGRIVIKLQDSSILTDFRDGGRLDIVVKPKGE
jgi:hypothetical protein